MIKTIAIITLINILAFSSLKAQTNDSSFYRPAQVSFVTPLGTNGLESYKYTNNLSFNILAGYAGGVDGFELGALVNLLKYDMQGCQIAGIGNTVLGSVTGAQIAGIYNVNKVKTNGLQIAGITNYTNTSEYITQFAGISNIVIDTVQGAQIAGIVNVSEGLEGGLQLAGITNVSSGRVIGSQIAGIANISSNNMNGAQISAITNVCKGSAQGAQISGIANVATDSFVGSQISGIVNYTKSLQGFQLSFINVADTVESGIPFGFISVVRKNGYRKFELFTSETLYLGANFKIGTSKFYNIFSIAASGTQSEFAWAFGYGIGTEVPINKKLNVNFDISASQMSYNEWWTNRLSLLNKFSITPSYKINNWLTFYAGVSINVHVMDRYYEEGVEQFNKSYVPYSTVQYFSENVITELYPGFTAGFRF